MTVPGLLRPVATAVPARRPGTVRRSSNVDCIRMPGDPYMWSVCRISGAGRDLLNADQGALTLDQAHFEVETDTGNAITSVGSGPPPSRWRRCAAGHYEDVASIIVDQPLEAVWTGSGQ